MFRKRNEGGFYLIGLLIVLAIIGYLTYGGYFGSSAGQVSTYQMSMGKTRKAECDATRAIWKTYILQWQIKNPGQTPTVDEMVKSGAPNHKCLEGGTYTIGRDGEMYCTVHYPDPSQATPTPAQ